MTWARPSATLLIAVLLFFTNGADAVYGFMKSDSVVEILGGFGVLLTVALSYVVQREKKKADATPA